MDNRAWIGVDLDGTLAHYNEWEGPTVIGAPIPLMVERIQKWVSEGTSVRIFTARVSCEEPTRSLIIAAIGAWCVEHLGFPLSVTCQKDFDMLELWDDRAVQVEPNTGELIGRSTRGL